jgi:hypothetical protein
MRNWALVFVWVVVLAGSADAFDNRKKGFILGGGLGAAGTTFSQEIEEGGVVVGESESETKAGLLTDFKIGYGPSEQMLIYYFSHVTWFSIENVFENDVTIANGVGGLGVTYFFRPFAPTWFIVGGIGLSSWGTPFEENSESMTGFGIWVGAGHEFKEHWMVELTLGAGQPSDEEYNVKATTDAATIGISINYLGY